MSDTQEPEVAATPMMVDHAYTFVRTMLESLAAEVHMSAQEGSSFDIASIMNNILSAETEEEIWARQELGSVASKDYLGKPFALKSENITWMKSQPGFIAQGAFPFYALLKVDDAESGEEVAINGGGASFCASLYRLQQLGGFESFPDGRPLILQGKATAGGNTVVLLKPLASPNKSRRGQK